MALEQIGLQAILDDKQFQQSLARYTAGIGQMTKITDGAGKVIGGAFKVATGALLIGAGAIGGILATSVKAAADAEQIAAQTDAVLQSTKGVAGVTREAVGDLATALSELTPFEDDAIQGGENLLLTFTNIGKNVFPLATETMLDMSQAMGQDLKSSAIQLGKALNQPAEGLSALQRVGVQFTKAQEDQVKALVAAGKTEEAQRVILKELQTEFGGAAKAAGKTFAGQLQILKNTLGNVQEEIGGALLPILTKLAGAFVKVLADPKVKAGIKAITQGIEDLVDIIGDLTAGRGYNALFRFYYLIERTFGAATAKSIYNILSALGGLKDFIANQIVPVAQRLWGAFQAGGLEGLGGQIARELAKAWPAISAQLKTWGVQFWDWLTGPGGALEQAGAQLGKIGGAIQVWAQENGTKLFAGLQGLASDFWQWLWGPGGALERTGVQLEKIMYAMKIWIENNANMQPVWDALGNWISLFWSWVTGRGGVLDTVATNMDKLSADLLAWAQDPKTAKALEDIGAEIARTIIDGIGKLFTTDQARSDSAMSHLVNSLNQARINLAASLSAVGANVAVDFVNALVTRLGGPDLTEALRAGIYAWFNAAIQAFVLGNTQPLIQMLIDGILGKVNPAPAAPAPYSPLPSGVSQFANGGWVNRTGMALVHRGEYVIPARQAQNISNNNSRTIMPGAIVFQIQGGSNLTEKQLENVAYRVVARVMEAA